MLNFIIKDLTKTKESSFTTSYFFELHCPLKSDTDKNCSFSLKTLDGRENPELITLTNCGFHEDMCVRETRIYPYLNKLSIFNKLQKNFKTIISFHSNSIKEVVQNFLNYTNFENKKDLDKTNKELTKHLQAM